MRISLFTNIIANSDVGMNVRVMKVTAGRKSKARSTALVLRAVAAALAVGTSLVMADAIVGGNAPALGKPALASPIEAGDIAAMVDRLSEDSFLVREKSTTDLWKMGKAALPALRQASAGGDPEAADRADELILYISAGVLFDSSEEVKTLVLKFSRSKIEAKLGILQKLMQIGHWKQVLHLAKLEERQDLRAQMSKIVKAAAIQAARDAIVKGDLDLAADILELHSDDAELMVLKAWFHVRQGNLKRELNKAAFLSGKNGALWRMSLHRAAGDVPAAIKEAQKAGQQHLADALRVLEGDALPWLRLNTQRNNLDVIYGMGCKIQQARLEGDHKKAGILARELSQLGRNDDTIARATICLAANGYRQQAVDLLVKHDVASAFDYFDTTESPQKCLEVLDIPKDAKPPYTTWVKNYTAKAIEDEDDERYDQLLTLASFLVHHGQGEHAKDVLTPLMAALEADGSDEWFDLLSTMSAYSLGTEAIYFIEKRGNEDGEADLGVRKMLGKIPSNYLSHIWNHLKKRNNQDISKALHEIALLAGVIADPENEVDKLHKGLADEVADNAGADKGTRMEALHYFSRNRNDFVTASRMADKMAAENDRWKGSKQGLDEILLRWKKMEPIYEALVEKNPGNYLNLTKWYIALRKLGHEEQAIEVLDRVLLLSMGSAKGLNQIGWEIHAAGYENEAVKVWLQAAAVAEPEGYDYDQAIAYLAHYGQSIYRKKQWKKAASIAEVNAQLSMRGRSSSSINVILRTRFYAEFSQGMYLLQTGQKSRAITKLNACRKMIPGDGTLADEFFPHLRKAGIGKLYDQWFEESYNHILTACQLYPKSHNSQNTAAWLASRSIRMLDEALKHSEAALMERPTQGAYLDTMAEVWFAKGNRAKAIEWSQKAVDGSIANAQGNPRSESMVFANYKQLNKQLERFKNEPLPK